jgi:replication factor A1
VFAIKGARVSDYGGKSLNAGEEHSQIYIDPEHKRAHELKAWYAANPNLARQHSITAQRGEGGDGFQRPDNFKLIQEVLDAVAEDTQALNSNYGAGPQKSKFYKISGFVQHVKTDDKMIYNACPDCNKKVQDEPAGYRCENCNKVHMTMVPTYMMTAKFSDLSGSIYIQFPRELGDPIMGQSAKDFQEFKERANREGDSEIVIRTYLAEHVINKSHQLLIKATENTYARGAEGETRFKFYASKVYSHSVVEEDAMLLKRLQKYSDKVDMHMD